jgi:hypothetical protein
MKFAILIRETIVRDIRVVFDAKDKHHALQIATSIAAHEHDRHNGMVVSETVTATPVPQSLSPWEAVVARGPQAERP